MHSFGEKLPLRSGSLPSIINGGTSSTSEAFFSSKTFGVGNSPFHKSIITSPKDAEWGGSRIPFRFPSRNVSSNAFQLNVGEGPEEPSSPVSPSRHTRAKNKGSLAYDPQQLQRVKTKLEQSLAKVESMRKQKEDVQSIQAEERLRKRILDSYETEKNPMKAFNVFMSNFLEKKMQKIEQEKELGTRVEVNSEKEEPDMTNEAAEAIAAANKIKSTVNRIQARYKIKKVSKAQKFYEGNIKIFKSLDTFVDAREFLEELNPLKVRKKHKQYENLRAINVLQKIQKESSDYFQTKMQQISKKKMMQLESPLSSNGSENEEDSKKDSENLLKERFESIELLEQMNPQFNSNIIPRRKIDYSKIPDAIPIASVMKETINPAGLIKPRRRIKQIDEKKKLTQTLTKFLEKKVDKFSKKKEPMEAEDVMKVLIDDKKNDGHTEDEFYEFLQDMLVVTRRREAGIISNNYNQERSIEAIKTLEKFVADLLKKVHEQKQDNLTPKKIEEDFKQKSRNVVNMVAAASRLIYLTKNQEIESPLPRKESINKMVTNYSVGKPLENKLSSEENDKPKARGLIDRKSLSGNLPPKESFRQKSFSKIMAESSGLGTQGGSTFLTHLSHIVDPALMGKTDGATTDTTESHGEKQVMFQKKRLNKMLSTADGQNFVLEKKNVQFFSPSSKKDIEKSNNNTYRFKSGLTENASLRITDMMKTLSVIQKEAITSRQQFKELDHHNMQEFIKSKIEPPLESLYLTYERPAPFTQKNFKKIRNIAKRV